MQEKMLRALCSEGAAVYVYLGDPETGRRFLEQAEREGLTFGDGVKPAAHRSSDIIALHPDGTLAYVGFAGHAAFGGGAKAVGQKPLRRVDYQKFMAGAADIEYRPPRRGRMVSERPPFNA